MMPTYEYKCRRCGHRFEKFQGIKEAPLQRCPKCRGRVQRLLGGGAGILFKGSGFHTTDYRSPGYKKAARAEKTGDVKKTAPAEKAPAGGGPKTGADA